MPGRDAAEKSPWMGLLVFAAGIALLALPSLKDRISFETVLQTLLLSALSISALALLLHVYRRRGLRRVCYRLYTSRLAPAGWVVDDARRFVRTIRALSRSSRVGSVELSYDSDRGEMLLEIEAKKDYITTIDRVLKLYNRGIILESCNNSMNSSCEERIFYSVTKLIKELKSITNNYNKRFIIIDFKSYTKHESFPSNVKVIDVGEIIYLDVKLGIAARELREATREAKKGDIVLIILDPADVDYNILVEEASGLLDSCIVYKHISEAQQDT